ncbi:hypothetical protein BAMA_15710 [Bacillus manliponensis]|uniref:Major virion structural protein n=1 Tax=Bacillus manliponensis TaxID=574376 RepID=A0A073JSV5_9BACI|nr:hypothetical protein [Bacillus manliponensis]KEK17332.1 hypothetical protein BAMA_15710 [Bacillus manliponensis]
MWFDKTANLQTLPNELEKQFVSSGWKKDLFYRIQSSISRFIDVRLFESIGSDGEQRRFGFAVGYDSANSDFKDNRYVSPESKLGMLGYGDEVKTTFTLPTYPVIQSSVMVYIDGLPFDKSKYTVNGRSGVITFHTAPAKNVKVTCEYRLAADAYDPSNEFIFFTYDKYLIEQELKISDEKANLGNGNGTKTTFKLPFNTMDEMRLQVYKNDKVVFPTEYVFDGEDIVFHAAPASSDNIKVSGIYTVEPNEERTIPNIPASTAFDVKDVKKVIAEVYSSLVFINASPYTTISFTPSANFTNDWKRDSVVYMYGNTNKDRLVLFMRIDPTPAPVRALFVPLYIGRIYTFDNKPLKNLVMIGGCRSGGQFSHVKDQKIGDANVDYGENTGNGNMYAMLSKSMTGAMYQKHYFAFFTHNKEIDSGQGRFNPSMYSGKYHLSQIYIVHPNDGYVGKLDDVYAVHSKNIQQADELELEKTVTNESLGKGDGIRKVFHLEHKAKGDTLQVLVACAEIPKEQYTYNPDDKTITFEVEPNGEVIANYQVGQIYRYSLPTTDVSPMTTDECTPFNPIGLAIYKEDM